MLGVSTLAIKRVCKYLKLEQYANYRYLKRSKRQLELSFRSLKISKRDLTKP